MARVYWVTQSNVFLGTESGARLEPQGDDPPPPPDWLADVLRVRLIIGDPICTALVYADVLPDTALDGVCYTAGDGRYQMMIDGEWSDATLKFQDAPISGYTQQSNSIWVAAQGVIKAELIRLDTLCYITNGGAGAQSVSFLNAQEQKDLFNLKLDYINDMIAQTGGTNRVCAVPYPVGGVYE